MPSAAHGDDLDLGVECQKDWDQVRGRRRTPEVSAEGSPVAQRKTPHGVDRSENAGQLVQDPWVALELAQGERAPDREGSALPPEESPRHSSQGDQECRSEATFIDIQQKVGPPGDR